MIPGTFFEIVDQSDIPQLTTNQTTNNPIMMIGFTSDKGTEDYVYVEGKPFFKQYGDTISFAKHGQALLQAANAINSGAKLFCKRIVAQDATLGNNGLIGYVKVESVQKTDTDGNKLYIDSETGEETIVEEGNDPAMESYVVLDFNVKSIEKTESNDLDNVATKFKESVVEENGFPLMIFADVGRGVSNKRLTITPDYDLSRTYEYTKYIVQLNENNDDLGQLTATFNPNIIEVESNISFERVINSASNPQIRCKQFEDKYSAFVAKIKEYLMSEAIGMTAEEVDALNLEMQDLLFAKTYKGTEISDKIRINTDNPLNSIYGISLDNGSNGSFGDAPINAATYAEEMAKVFDGSFSDDIYNFDNNPIDLVIDANYPDVVKRAIEDFVEFREDVFYMRDIANEIEGVRVPCKSIAELKVADIKNRKSRYIATYITYYDIIDPYTKKQINVSICYSLARIMVSHFVNGPSRPVAGIRYNCVIPEAIEGTVNYTPKITPAGNQKTDLEDMRLNYATYVNQQFVIETEYTSQEKFTQLSYINNVLNIQQIIHTLRKRCPVIRYAFLDGKDFENYKTDINNELEKFSGNFETLTMEYVEDAAYRSNKIYYAILKVQFRNFIQTEKFKIVALQS